MTHPRLNSDKLRLTRRFPKWLLAALCAAWLLLPALQGFCDPVTLFTARQVAENKLRDHIAMYGHWNGNASPVIADQQTVYAHDTAVAYNFVVDPSGHILVAADDVLSPVLLYSAGSTFDPDRAGQPLSIESWIVPEVYHQVQKAQQLQRADGYRSSSLSIRLPSASRTGSRIRQAWVAHTGASGQRLEPLDAGVDRLPIRSAASSPDHELLSSSWGQGDPYNLWTPVDGCAGGHTLTGCVATAWGQLMRYWSWPLQGRGAKSYLWNGQTLQVDFSAVEYLWNDMPDQLDGSSTGGQKDAVARMLYHVGVAAEMDYGCSTSESLLWADQVLPAYFKYKPTMQLLERANHSAANWLELFKGEFDHDPPRPVILSIFLASGMGGHEVVADGYQDDGTDLIHINFGWEGYGDGFYNITSQFQAPSGGYVWDANNQVIVLGIEPDNAPPTVEAGDDQAVDEGERVELTGSAADPENIGISRYQWSQVEGTAVTLSNASSATASFTAPNVHGQTRLVFQFRADDANRAFATDTTTVTLTNSDNSTAPALPVSGSSGGGGCFIRTLF
jgi:hypothetical protein